MLYKSSCLEFFKVIHAQALEALHIIAVNIIANLSDYGGKLYTDKQLFPTSSCSQQATMAHIIGTAP